MIGRALVAAGVALLALAYLHPYVRRHALGGLTAAAGFAVSGAGMVTESDPITGAMLVLYAVFVAWICADRWRSWRPSWWHRGKHGST